MLNSNSAFVAIILIVINTLVFFLLPDNLKFLGMKDNQAIKDGEFYRLFTGMFLHADFFHLLSNCYGILIFSDLVRVTGVAWFLGIYLLAGIAGNVFSFLFNPYPSLGASGAVFGLIGAFFFISGFSPNILIYIVISFVYSAMPDSRIDFYAHLGGLLVGLLTGGFFGIYR
jgi:rhomboid protease GluP